MREFQKLGGKLDAKICIKKLYNQIVGARDEVLISFIHQAILILLMQSKPKLDGNLQHLQEKYKNFLEKQNAANIWKELKKIFAKDSEVVAIIKKYNNLLTPADFSHKNFLSAFEEKYIQLEQIIFSKTRLRLAFEKYIQSIMLNFNLGHHLKENPAILGDYARLISQEKIYSPSELAIIAHLFEILLVVNPVPNVFAPWIFNSRQERISFFLVDEKGNSKRTLNEKIIILQRQEEKPIRPDEKIISYLEKEKDLNQSIIAMRRNFWGIPVSIQELILNFLDTKELYVKIILISKGLKKIIDNFSPKIHFSLLQFREHQRNKQWQIDAELFKKASELPVWLNKLIRNEILNKNLNLECLNEIKDFLELPMKFTESSSQLSKFIKNNLFDWQEISLSQGYSFREVIQGIVIPECIDQKLIDEEFGEIDDKNSQNLKDYLNLALIRKFKQSDFQEPWFSAVHVEFSNKILVEKLRGLSAEELIKSYLGIADKQMSVELWRQQFSLPRGGINFWQDIVQKGWVATLAFALNLAAFDQQSRRHLFESQNYRDDAQSDKDLLLIAAEFKQINILRYIFYTCEVSAGDFYKLFMAHRYKLSNYDISGDERMVFHKNLFSSISDQIACEFLKEILIIFDCGQKLAKICFEDQSFQIITDRIKDRWLVNGFQKAIIDQDLSLIEMISDNYNLKQWLKLLASSNDKSCEFIPIVYAINNGFLSVLKLFQKLLQEKKYDNSKEIWREVLVRMSPKNSLNVSDSDLSGFNPLQCAIISFSDDFIGEDLSKKKNIGRKFLNLLEFLFKNSQYTPEEFFRIISVSRKYHEVPILLSSHKYNQVSEDIEVFFLHLETILKLTQQDLIELNKTFGFTPKYWQDLFLKENSFLTFLLFRMSLRKGILRDPGCGAYLLKEEAVDKSILANVLLVCDVKPGQRNQSLLQYNELLKKTLKANSPKMIKGDKFFLKRKESKDGLELKTSLDPCQPKKPKLQNAQQGFFQPVLPLPPSDRGFDLMYN